MKHRSQSPSRLPRLLALLLALSVLLGLGAWFTFRPQAPQRSESAGPERAAVEAGSELGAAGAPARARALEPRRYTFELKNQFAPAESEDEGTAFSLLLSASLTLAPLTQSGSQRLQLSELVFRDGASDQRQDNAQVAALRRSLEQPFVARFDGSGRVEELEFSFSADAFAEGILRTLVAALQFVAPPDATASEWSALELDTVGEAKVQYRKLGPRSYLKTKTSYVRLLTDGGLLEPARAGTAASVNGSTQVERDASGALERLRFVETVTTRVGELAFVNAAELTLRFAGSAQVAAQVAAPPPGTARSARLGQLPERAPVDPQQAQRELLGNARFEDLTQELAQLGADDVEGRRSSQERLAAALALSLGDARELEPLVASGSEAAASVALGALADANTPEAQAALRELSQAEGVKFDRRDSALALLGLSEEPAAETSELTRSISKDPEHPSRRTATLALGNLAQKLRAQGDSTGDELLDDLFARLKAAPSEDERTLLLGAIGNTGDAELPQLLAPWLEHSAVETRAAATWALRLVDSEPAFVVLAKKALGDTEIAVRLKAVAALRYRHADRSLGVVGNVLRQDKDSSVRLEALSTLAQSDSADVLALVRWVAEHDTDPSVQQQAASMLEAAG